MRPMANSAPSWAGSDYGDKEELSLTMILRRVHEHVGQNDCRPAKGPGTVPPAWRWVRTGLHSVIKCYPEAVQYYFVDDLYKTRLRLC